MIESFHQTLSRGLGHLGHAQTMPLEEVVASILYAYRSTPVLATGETPSFMMTGTELVLPKHQEFLAWALPDEVSEEYLQERMKVLVEARRNCVEKLLHTAGGQGEHKRKKLAKAPVFEEGDVVVYRWAPWELRHYRKATGLSSKFLPNWSEPCRVQKVLGEGKTQLEVKSLWYQTGGRRIVSASEVQKLSRDLPTAALNEWKLAFATEREKLRQVRRPPAQDTSMSRGDSFIRNTEGELNGTIIWDELSRELAHEDQEDVGLLINEEGHNEVSTKRQRGEPEH
eukprot:GHVS01045212.1.p2 GENE.GHVS01045212.1~~GHVS01045212.1.p2  ORF type:complete len:284 (-),score=37.49 GHVS01045212.1:364-1215(-)